MNEKFSPYFAIFLWKIYYPCDIILVSACADGNKKEVQ